ncbi:MAG: adenylate/guanylate cyclase domain-containing protein [Verrucomicrobiota bacterium]
MKATLTSVETGETSDLNNVAIIGRSPECNIQIGDPVVSRRHGMIRKQGDGFWLFDLGSFNGCYVNGARITSAYCLQDGDSISIAEHEFKYRQIGGTLTQPVDDFGGSTVALIKSTPVIILVSDIKGFTTLSENLPPDDLAQVMGNWYSDCEIILSQHGATVDKFIGDCVLAYWTKIDLPTLKQSMRAAEALMASCQKINEQRSDVFQSIGLQFDSGVALHTGKVAVGGMGGGEFTLVGDPVNLAFRLESLTRSLGKMALVTSEFIGNSPVELRKYCENQGTHQVKGRAQGVEVWSIESYPDY